eukprot:420567-Prorocentrum_lima.AAC.1
MSTGAVAFVVIGQDCGNNLGLDSCFSAVSQEDLVAHFIGNKVICSSNLIGACAADGPSSWLWFCTGQTTLGLAADAN